MKQITNINTLLLTGLLGIITVSFSYCFSGKYFSDQITIKKNVDTLALISVYSHVTSTIGNDKNDDLELAKNNKKIIENKTKEILSEKYVLTDNTAISNLIQEDGLSAFFSNLEARKGSLSKIKIPLFINQNIKSISERYCLLLFFSGQYDKSFEPNFVAKQAVFNSRLYVNIPIPKSDLKMVIIDKQIGSVIHYDNIRSKKDPRLHADIEMLTSQILKPIYYK